MSFFSHLIAETAAEREGLYGVPQIRDGLEGRIGLPTYIAYLAEAYHHVKHTVPLMRAARAGLTDPAHARFRDALDEYIAEETGHEAWILNDIAAAGGDAEAVRRGEPRPATELMVAYAYDFIARRNAMGFFGMVFVLEGTSNQLATKGAEAVQKSLGLPAGAFTYLRSHGSLDQEHILFLRRLLDDVDVAEDQAAIIHMAKRMFLLFAEVFRSIPHTRIVNHAL